MSCVLNTESERANPIAEGMKPLPYSTAQKGAVHWIAAVSPTPWKTVSPGTKVVALVVPSLHCTNLPDMMVSVILAQ